MKLESLKSGKFGKTTLTPETMKMVNGGGQQKTNIASNNNSPDYWNYYCSGPKGEQYDKDLHGTNGVLLKSQISDTIFEGSLDSWYNYDGTVG
ncbi:hypothetical protein BN1088_1433346 [Sphingobacterium sp. PM2-P1-29]|nr:hypothetical protein BN1088_1433346 [Sphingobacterium sp. PM2-P1-29]